MNQYKKLSKSLELILLRRDVYRYIRNYVNYKALSYFVVEIFERTHNKAYIALL